MRDRIAHIISAEKLTNQQFAMEMEISPASVTHILSGRNNPGLDLVVKIARRFPHYNLRWLVLGEMPIHNAPEAKSECNKAQEDKSPATSTHQPQLFNEDSMRSQPQAEAASKERATQSSASRLLICHSDGTYSEYVKRER